MSSSQAAGIQSMKVPDYGLGLSHRGGGDFRGAVRHSIACGVRLFDTASRYGTEAVLGEVLAEANLARDEFFVSTKLWPDHAGDPASALRASLGRLGLDSVDLYLVHWPGIPPRGGETPSQARLRVWRDMEKLQEAGLARAVGVSNFQARHLADLCDEVRDGDAGEIAGGIPVAVNQLEFNPLHQQRSLVRACCERGVRLMGYSPLAKGAVLEHPEVRRVAKASGCTAAQAAIAWSVQRGAVTIPKSTKPQHIEQNLAGAGMTLPEEALRALDALDCGYRCTWDPTNVP